MRIILLSLFSVSFAFMVTSPSYLDPVFSSYQLARELGIKADVDDSHNHVHAKEVLFWACDIMSQNRERLSNPRDIQMIAQCSLLHDTIDEKYVDYSPLVRKHLGEWYEDEESDMLMRIMKDMSYGKVMEHGFPQYPSNYMIIYHMVREADLLSSFNLARMIEYRRYNKKMAAMNYTDDLIRKEVIDLFDARMGKLVSNELFIHESSRKRATELDSLARLRLLLLPTLAIHEGVCLDILRNVNHLDIYTLIMRLNELAVYDHEQVGGEDGAMSSSGGEHICPDSM